MFLVLVLHLELLSHDGHGAARDIEPADAHGADVRCQLAVALFQGFCLEVLRLVGELLKALFIEPFLGLCNDHILLIIIWPEVANLVHSCNLAQV